MTKYEYLNKQVETLENNITEFYNNEMCDGVDMVDFIAGLNFLNAYQHNSDRIIIETYNQNGAHGVDLEVMRHGVRVEFDGTSMSTGIHAHIASELYDAAEMLIYC